MGDSLNVIMSGQQGEFVELAAGDRASKVKGRLFRKQILHLGSFQHPKIPGKKVTIDKTFAETMVQNFKNGICDIVQVPIVDGANRHVEDPERNIGRVIDLEYDDKGVYAYIDALKHADDLGKTMIGASAMMSMNYTNTTTGEKVGPALLHCAITNRPYITNLEDFSEVISASADTNDEETFLLGADSESAEVEEEVAASDTSDEEVEEIASSEVQDETVSLGAADNEENDMPKTLEELFAALKEEHNIDVAALQAKVEEQTTALSNVLGDDAEVEGEELTLSDLASAFVELSKTNEEQAAVIADLQKDRDELRLSAATVEIDDLVSKGRILPKQRDKMLELSMKDRETFEALLPEEPIVALSAEEGFSAHEDTRGADDKNTQTEIQRILALAKSAK